MHTQRLISLDDASEWQRVLDTVPHGYWHTVNACRALQSGTSDRVVLYVCTDQKAGLSAALPFAERQWGGAKDIYTPAGFSGFVSNGGMPFALESWKSFALKEGYVCGYFALHPKVASPDLHSSIASHNELFVLDIGQGHVKALESFDADTRRQLRNWKSAGVETVWDRGSLSAYLIENYHAFMQAAGAKRSTIWAAATLEAICADPNVFLIGVADASGICSVSLFGKSPFCAEYLANVRSLSGKKLAPLLLQSAIEHLALQGVPWLNLGGGAVRDDTIARSKRRYGGQCVPFLVAKEIYDPKRYAALCAEGPSDSSYFPPYRASVVKTTGAKDA
jgi:hypothetical protein